MQKYSKTDVDLSLDEIDLSSILNNSKNIVNRWKKTLFYFLFGGLLLGIFFYVITPKKYKSRMFVHSTLLKGPMFVLVVNNLQRHLDEKNYSEVARLLEMDSTEAMKIQLIDINSVKYFTEKQLNTIISTDELAKEDDYSTGDFIIEAYVQDYTILKKLEKGLVNYLNNNDYIKLKSIERKKNLNLVKNRVHNELRGLDSLKNSLTNLYNQGKSSGSGISVYDPSAIYNHILEMYKTELNTEVEINNPDIAVIEGFVIYKKPDSPKLSSSLLNGFLISFVAAIVFIVYMELKKRLAN